jgi:lipopolysaccharide/colanic/teichoic acid biosynthesis glycosyltransferase
MPFKSLLALRLRGVIVQDGVEAYERLTGKVPIEALTPTSMLFGNEFRDFQLDLCVARAVSVPVAAMSLVLLMPVFVLIALAIMLESPGPLFFVQERVGRKGKRFKLIKFRTMRPTNKPTSEWERDNHNRLTRVGRHLRRSRLDELPQLINILKGDMNLVGPRPHPVSNLQLFAMVTRNVPECGEQIPYYALRSMVRPGLTGWAQVRYHYANDLEEEIEKMRYDLYYIKHRSAWLDARILLETVGVVLRGPVTAKPLAAASRLAEPAPRESAPVLHLADEPRVAALATVPTAPTTPVTFETTLDFAPPALQARRATVPGPAKRRQAPIGDEV